MSTSPHKKPLPDGFVPALERIVGKKHVTTDREQLEPISHDETPGLAHAFPDVYVQPQSAAEVAHIMQEASHRGVYVTPRGAGTGKSGGCVPVYGGVVIGFDRMVGVQSLDTENMVVDVAPGTVLRDLHDVVEEAGLFYPPDPASLQWCTLGGNVAENAGGPRALRYGVTGEYVLGLDVVLPTGEAIRTGRRTLKGVAGYDLTRLMTGSEGTLGLITNITLRLLPQPRVVKTALCVFSSSEDAARAVARILAAGILPRTLEYMDGRSIRAVRDHGSPYPFADHAQAAIIVETDGDDETSTFAQLTRALEEATECGAIDTALATDERQRRSIWESRRLLSEATRKIKKQKVSEDIVVPRSKIPEMVAVVGALGQQHDLETCAFGHAGDGNLHVQILFDEDDEMPRVEALMEDLFKATVDRQGTITGEHGVGLAKMRYLGLELSPDVIALQRRLKAAFDPAGILNPGKFLPPA